MAVADVPGVDIAGVTFDAGSVNSPVLLQIGRPERGGGDHDGDDRTSASDPTALQDVFFRIGGPHVGKASVSLEVNSDNVILDDIWVWRADYGEGVGWTVKTAATGVVVNGDDVTATGLSVEHFQRYNLIWTASEAARSSFRTSCRTTPPTRRRVLNDGVNGWAAYRWPTR